MANLDWKLTLIILTSLGCATFLAYHKVDNEIIIAILGIASNIVTYHVAKGEKEK